MSTSADGGPRVIPAQLSFLAIYNPSLGNTDESVRDQILYYSSKENRRRTREKARNDSKADDEASEEENERLRQVGLAQGMVDFVKNFSNGAPVDYIETEKSRILVHELEPGWWILASIDLTRLPSAKSTSSSDYSSPTYEYSAREVSPTPLILRQILQAHAIFLLHHAPSLQDLFKRVSRSAFCTLLERFWNRFIRDWDVLLHGNPAVDIYNGVKLAGGGELGVGVGEEEWGSGEREVLEDFVSRTEGLVDLIVSRYGDIPGKEEKDEKSESDLTGAGPWLGADNDPRSSDGIIFSGVGSISRRSLATVSQWMDAIFKHGEDAYGVSENPSSRPRRRKRKASQKPMNGDLKSQEELPTRMKSPGNRAPDLRRKAVENSATPPGVPPPLVIAVETSLVEATTKSKSREASKSPRKEGMEGEDSVFGTDKMMKYLTLGYGSSWTLSPKGLAGNKESPSEASKVKGDNRGIPFKGAAENQTIEEGEASADGSKEAALQQDDPALEESDEGEEAGEEFVQRLERSVGKFIIGLSGDLEDAEFTEDTGSSKENKDGPPTDLHRRIFLRTLTVELAKPESMPSMDRRSSQISGYSSAGEPPTSASASAEGSQPIVHHRKLQVAVYAHQPFIFLFLFQLHTPSLTIPSFYRKIHHQLGPLQKPLLRSTDPAKVMERMVEAMGDRTATTTPVNGESLPQTIYDIIYDPVRLTVRTSIPNIPLPGSLAAEGLSSRSTSHTVSGSWYTLGIPISSGASTPPQQSKSGLVNSDWTRIEALNVHIQIMNTWMATRSKSELERTVKTGRGWWVLWMQIPVEYGEAKEAFLVRKARDHKATATGSSVRESHNSGRWLLREQSRDVSGSSARSEGGGVSSTVGVSEGVGVDARRWIEGLLHFL